MKKVKKVEIRVADLIRELNITQFAFANKTKLRPNAVSNLTRGYVDRISIEHLEKIATAFNIDDMNKLISIVEIEVPDDEKEDEKKA